MSLVRWQPGETHFKHQDTPGVVARHSKKKARDERLQEAYAAVDTRDQNRCRATGHLLHPGSVDPKFRREHHHLRGRRVRPDWREKPERICLVSKAVHDLINIGWIDCEGTDARKTLFFHYTPLAPVKKRILVLKRHTPREERQ
jgi:hypothetical protein